MSMFFVGRHTRGEEQSGRTRADRRSAGRRARAPDRGADRRDGRAGPAGRPRRVRHDRPRPAERRLARARRLADRRRPRVRRRRGGRGPDQPDHVGRLRDDRRGDRRRATCCAPRGMSATGRCRGCRRSAGAGHAPVRGRALVAAGAVARRGVRARRRGVRAARQARRGRRAYRAAARAGDRVAAPDEPPLGLALRLQRGALLGWSAGLFFSGLSIGLTGRDAEGPDRRQRPARHDPRLLPGRHRRPVLRGVDAGDGARRRGLRDPVGAADARRGDCGPPGVAARHRALARPLDGRLRRRRDGRHGDRARGERARAGLADAINSDDAGQLPRLLAAGLAPVPAVWVVVAVAVALFGLVPRAVGAAWGVLGACPST